MAQRYLDSFTFGDWALEFPACCDFGSWGDLAMVKRACLGPSVLLTHVLRYPPHLPCSLPAVTCSTFVLGGTEDPRYNKDQLDSWRDAVSGEVSTRWFPGGHMCVVAWATNLEGGRVERSLAFVDAPRHYGEQELLGRHIVAAFSWSAWCAGRFAPVWALQESQRHPSELLPLLCPSPRTQVRPRPRRARDGLCAGFCRQVGMIEKHSV